MLRVCILLADWKKHLVCILSGYVWQLLADSSDIFIINFCADLLIDFSDVLQVDPFTLGRTFTSITQDLCITLPLVGELSYFRYYVVENSKSPIGTKILYFISLQNNIYQYDT